jgi:hypothetical protein
VPKVQQDRKEIKVILALRVQQVMMVVMDLPELQVKKVILVLRVQQVLKDLKVNKV